MRRFLFLFILSWAFSASAQTGGLHRYHRATGRAEKDSLTVCYLRCAHDLDSLIQKMHTTAPDSEQVLSNPYYFPLFGASTYFDFAVRQQLGSLFPDSSAVESYIASELLRMYALSPQYITRRLDISRMPKLEDTVSPDQTHKAMAEVLEKTLSSAGAPPTSKDLGPDDGFRLRVERPDFWNYRGSFSLQFMQYYVTDNWYKGGEDHNSLLASLNLEANYDNKQKLTFNNKLEMKLGFQSSQSDTKHEYKTNADLIRMTNKLGLQAAKRWYYTVMLQSWTQFYPGYHANDAKVYSDFMSPFETILSLGMDYKYSRRKFDFSATLSPMAVDFKYVDRIKLAARYGIDVGHHSKFALGSTVTVNSKWEILPGLLWTVRLYAFTSYSRFQAEWENTFALKVNRYLSTKIFLFPRFDDGVARKKGQSYFQFNEYLSVGLDLGF